MSPRSQRRRGARWPLPLAVLAAAVAAGGGSAGCTRADEPASGARGSAGQAVESLTVAIPPTTAAPTATPLWERALDEVELPGGGLWSDYAPAGLATAGGRVLVSDAGNHEVLALDTAGRVVALAGGLGQREGELFTPGDLAPLGDRGVVADRSNARLVSLSLPDVSDASRLVLPGPPLRLAQAGGTLYALTLVPRAGLRLLRVAGCCVSPAVDTVELRPAPRAMPRSMAILPDGSVALLSLGGALSLYRADGALTRVVQFAADSASGRLLVAIVASASPRDRLVVSFGDVLGCFDVASSRLERLWQPPVSARGRLATVSLLSAGETGLYTYQPESHVLARYGAHC